MLIGSSLEVEFKFLELFVEVVDQFLDGVKQLVDGSTDGGVE